MAKQTQQNAAKSWRMYNEDQRQQMESQTNDLLMNIPAHAQYQKQVLNKLKYLINIDKAHELFIRWKSYNHEQRQQMENQTDELIMNIPAHAKDQKQILNELKCLISIYKVHKDASTMDTTACIIHDGFIQSGIMLDDADLYI